MNKALVGLAAVIIIAVGAVAVTRNSNTNKTTPSTATSPPSSSQNNTQSTQDTISYDGKSFNPAHLTVKSGTTVTIKNSSSENLQFQSNPHPVHTDDSDLNVGVVAPGQSKTFTATQKGTFGYHDHLNPSEKGTITIE